MTTKSDRVSVDTKYAGGSETFNNNLKALVHLMAKQTALDLKHDNDNHCREGGA